MSQDAIFFRTVLDQMILQLASKINPSGDIFKCAASLAVTVHYGWKSSKTLPASCSLVWKFPPPLTKLDEQNLWLTQKEFPAYTVVHFFIYEAKFMINIERVSCSYMQVQIYSQLSALNNPGLSSLFIGSGAEFRFTHLGFNT